MKPFTLLIWIGVIALSIILFTGTLNAFLSLNDLHKAFITALAALGIGMVGMAYRR